MCSTTAVIKQNHSCPNLSMLSHLVLKYISKSTVLHFFYNNSGVLCQKQVVRTGTSFLYSWHKSTVYNDNPCGSIHKYYRMRITAASLHQPTHTCLHVCWVKPSWSQRWDRLSLNVMLMVTLLLFFVDFRCIITCSNAYVLSQV